MAGDTVFEGIDLIMHGGDIQHLIVLDGLEEVAPVIAAPATTTTAGTTLACGTSSGSMSTAIGMTHAIEPEDRPIEILRKYYFDNEHIDITISGDTHMERIDYRDGVLQISSGNPTQPHIWSTRLGTVGLIEIGRGKLDARIIRLGETEGRHNPGVECSFTRETGVICL